MAAILTIAIFAIIIAVSNGSLNNKVDHYDNNRVNPSRMNMDVIHGKSAHEIRRNMVNGKYDWQPGDYDVYMGKKH